MRIKPILGAFSVALTLTFSAIGASVFAEDTASIEEASSTVLYSGVWAKKSFKASGTWEIYSEGYRTFVKLSDDFKTRKAPDLKLFLSPLAADATNGKNATTGSVLISPLESNKGAQVYELPADIGLADFKSILIHCEAYSKLWSAADLG